LPLQTLKPGYGPVLAEKVFPMICMEVVGGSRCGFRGLSKLFTEQHLINKLLHSIGAVVSISVA